MKEFLDSETKSEEREFNISLVLITGYLFIQIMSDLTVGKFISLGSTLSIPVGSLLYALSFTWVDLINDYLGKARARKTVNAAIVINILMVMWFRFYIVVPGAAWWVKDPFPQRAIRYVLGGVWRVIAASVATEFATEHTDITVFHFLRSRFPGLPRWTRAMISNTVSAPLDGALFALLAFLGTISLVDLWSAVWGSALYKMMVGYMSIPLLYLVRAKPMSVSASRHT